MWMDGYLKQNLDLAKKAIKKDWDMVFLVDGIEGSGKSVLAQQCASYCDPSFVAERICFTADEFKDTIANAEKYQAIIYDEAYQGLNSRSTMSELNKSIIAMMAEMRQKNLFVFIVLPSFFDLDRNAAIWRSRALLHVYTEDNFQRGHFTFFGHAKKKKLYIHGKKYYEYGWPDADFWAKFPPGYTVDEDTYRKRKLNALKAHAETREKGSRAQKWKVQRDKLIKRLHELGDTQVTISELINLPQSVVSKAITENS